MKKLKNIFMRILPLFLFSLSSLFLYIFSHYFWDTIALVGLTPPFVLLMMDDFPPSSSCGSSSSVPNPEGSVNQEAPNPEPPEPDLSHPLLDDNTRRAELDERAGFHFVGLSESQKEKVLDAQVKIERAIEKALLSDGYSRDELSQLTKRNEIRGFLFYPKGKLLSYKKYQSYVKEVEFGTHRSRPYQDLINAISSFNLFLTKVKKIKRWELGKVWEQWGGRR
jgi:hypothetical protein